MQSNRNWNLKVMGLKSFLALLTVLVVLVACRNEKKTEGLSPEGIAEGERLFKNSNCHTCHSLEGQSMYGPALDSILNTKVQVVRGGKEKQVVIDRKYIYKAIAKPDFEKVKEFEKRKMPMTTLSKDQIEKLTDYLIYINTNKQLRK